MKWEGGLNAVKTIHLLHSLSYLNILLLLVCCPSVNILSSKLVLKLNILSFSLFLVIINQLIDQNFFINLLYIEII